MLGCLGRYWPTGGRLILELPLVQHTRGGHQLRLVSLPDWHPGELLVPAWAAPEGDWERVDWLGAAMWFLHGQAERDLERVHGPVHSYSLRLDLDSRMWDKAWVNRIALFLRAWVAHRLGQSEAELFGPRPKAEFMLTHDVDAVAKTVAIRGKQTAFHLFNGLRQLARGRLGGAVAAWRRAVQFSVSAEDYWCFEWLMALEAAHGVTSHYNFYGGPGGWGRDPVRLLLDPAYNVDHPRLREVLARLVTAGHAVGLHQSFHAWQDAASMAREKARLEAALGRPVKECRQHWLRFSWQHTWQAQQEAGLTLDSTLGFNDRPGFRTAGALRYHPWDPETGRPMGLEVVPMVLMDSHLYDYLGLDDEAERRRHIDHWLDEVMAVGGVASLTWHQRVVSQDYGWGPGYEHVLARVAPR